MDRARTESDWNHTAQLLAMLFNIHRDRKKASAKQASDFHPLGRKRRPGTPINKGNFQLLGVLVGD